MSTDNEFTVGDRVYVIEGHPWWSHRAGRAVAIEKQHALVEWSADGSFTFMPFDQLTKKWPSLKLEEQE